MSLISRGLGAKKMIEVQFLTSRPKNRYNIWVAYECYTYISLKVCKFRKNLSYKEEKKYES